jgi:hypothetical protein
VPPSNIAPEVRAAALADLNAGEQPAIVAERYGIDPSKVRQWKKRYVTQGVTQSVTQAVTVVQRPALEAQQLALGELVMANLRAKLIATQRIAEHVINPTWLDKQNASDVAELFECLDRSAIGILDRLAGGQRRDPAESEGESS